MKDVWKFLAKLGKELPLDEKNDTDSRQILDELHKDAELIEESGSEHVERMLDRIKQLEAKFASEHPAIEQAARELADALAKMGI
jgi:hypothetical protein